MPRVTSSPLAAPRVGNSPLSWITFGAAAIAALAVSLGASLWLERDGQLRDTTATAHKLAVALERHTEATFDLVDSVLRTTARELEQEAHRGPLSDDEAAAILRRNLDSQGAIYRLSIRDARGIVTSVTTFDQLPHIDTSQRDYFKVHRESDAVGTFVAKPVRNAVDGVWVIPISRRLNGPHGEFAGVVVATLPISYFSDFFRSLQIGEHGILDIFRADGTTLVRDPPENLIGVQVPGSPIFTTYLPKAPAGELRAPTASDGIDRIFSYRKLARLPLVVVIGVAVDDALAPWHARVRFYVGLWFLCATVLSIFTWVMARQAGRESAAQAAAAAIDERFRRLVANVPGVVFQRVRRRDGTIGYNFMSGQVDQLFGYKAEEVIENPALISRLDSPAFEAAIEASAQDLSTLALDHRVVRGDGTVRWMRTISTPTRLAGGEVIWDGVAIDITDRKAMEIALKQSEAQAYEANRAKSEFLAMMSHELRTPLNAILGFSEVIRDYGDNLTSTKRREYASDIHASGSLLLTLVNDVLDLTKAESGKMDLQLEPVDVPDLIARSVRMVSERATQQGIKVIEQTRSQLPVLSADSRKLMQVILNLLSNSVKFTPNGGQVTVSAEAESDGWIVIKVSDTGVGIAPDDIAKALAPFGQVDNILTREHSGTGLGLPLARRLTELHGGSFDIESRVNAGTIITLRFPLNRRAAGVA